MTDRTVRIAAGQGFWGDWLEAPVHQVLRGPIDYLMMDYLAEVTMSIMQKQRNCRRACEKPEPGMVAQAHGFPGRHGWRVVRLADAAARRISARNLGNMLRRIQSRDLRQDTEDVAPAPHTACSSSQ